MRNWSLLFRSHGVKFPAFIFKHELFKNNCGIVIDSLSGTGCAKGESRAAYTPYLLNGGSAIDRSIMAQLSPMPVARELTHLSLSFGADNLALAQMTRQLQEYSISLMGHPRVCMRNAWVVLLERLKIIKML